MNQQHDEAVVPEETIDESVQEQATPVQSETNIDYKEKWLRAQADYQNLTKEISTQKKDWIRMSEMQIVEEFIPIYENFKKAFAHSVADSHAQWENWQKGIGFIMKQYWDMLSSHGVQEIKTTGTPFDHHLHEALQEEAAEDVEDGVIIRELSGGYMMYDKVIIPAKVVVCRK